MEQPLSSLVFNGSIIEAITEAKQQKKLFVVYVSGGNMESNQLETSTWLDPRVVDSISKYCILLHILEGSIDARNFSALYPQKVAPCITAIGYNGVQLWQNEGFVSADNLASGLEKAWLSHHVQEATTTFLTAALASKKELLSGSSSKVESCSSDQVDSQIQHSPTANNSQIVEGGEDYAHPATEVDPLVVDMASHGSADAFESRIGEFNDSDAPITVEEKPRDLVAVDSSKIEDEPLISEENPNLCDQHMDPIEEAPGEIANIAREGPEMNTVEDAALTSKENPNLRNQHMDPNEEAPVEIVNKAGKVPRISTIEVADALSNTSQRDVYLNIRLPDGSSLQVKFLVTDTLRMVKDYVDKNQTSIIGSYHLAVPYPRKVFSDQDLDRELSELGLQNRQALIIILRNKVKNTSLYGQSSTAGGNQSAIGGDEGYFAVIRKLFSYVNPFSYLGGSSNTAQDSQNSTLQYGSNSTPQNNRTLAGRPYKTRTTSTTSDSQRPASSRFGSNIHTLKHDEDENKFSDKNTFWNGNSTQFGGDDNSNSK